MKRTALWGITRLCVAGKDVLMFPSLFPEIETQHCCVFLVCVKWGLVRAANDWAVLAVRCFAPGKRCVMAFRRTALAV